jgi:hypothetical protein
MTLHGHIKGGAVVLDQPAALPDGTPVEVRTVERPLQEPAATATLGEWLMRYAGTVKGFPSDLARNHDRYIHGTPRK